MKKTRNKKGFTLIELIIVIAIIGIVAAIAVPKFGNIQKDAKIKADIASAKVIADATRALMLKDGIVTTKYITAQKIDTDIKDYIQSEPKVKAINGSEFQVRIDWATENIYVTVNNVELYPKQDENYGVVASDTTTTPKSQ